MPKTPALYLKSEIPSYPTARPSRDLIVTVQAGDFIFENWYLKLKTPFHEYNPGRYKIAAKVVDIFGNDTMKIVEASA
jgi:hypothetical protein